MRWADRDARRRRATELGRIAYRLVREEAASGVLELDAEEKHLREFEESGIEVQLLTPFRADARPDEFSRLQVRRYGRKVLELRWSKVSDASIVAFEEGDWEDVLESEPPPIAFE
jgi:hypothetical protein